MTTQTEAMKLALEGASNYIDVLGGDSKKYRQLLAQQSPQRSEDIKERSDDNEQVEPTEVRLWDSQWTNVVNHDNCYQGWDKEDAINHAVKMTEKYIASNFAKNTHPPVPYVVEPRTAQPKEPAVAEQHKQEPVGALLLGGIFQTSEGFEFEEWDVEWNNKAVEALQEKLVTSDPVTLNLYTTPPQRKPLTDKQLNIIGSRWHLNLLGADEKAELFAFARAIEATHGIKEKNT